MGQMFGSCLLLVLHAMCMQPITNVRAQWSVVCVCACTWENWFCCSRYDFLFSTPYNVAHCIRMMHSCWYSPIDPTMSLFWGSTRNIDDIWCDVWMGLLLLTVVDSRLFYAELRSCRIYAVQRKHSLRKGTCVLAGLFAAVHNSLLCGMHYRLEILADCVCDIYSTYMDILVSSHEIDRTHLDLESRHSVMVCFLLKWCGLHILYTSICGWLFGHWPFTIPVQAHACTLYTHER